MGSPGLTQALNLLKTKFEQLLPSFWGRVARLFYKHHYATFPYAKNDNMAGEQVEI